MTWCVKIRHIIRESSYEHADLDSSTATTSMYGFGQGRAIMTTQGEKDVAPAGTKGKPFQAQFEMRRLQKQPRDDAPDNMTGLIYRDSEGRERMEEHIEAQPGLTLKFVHISDPVEKMTYTLEAASKTILRKEPLSERGFSMWAVDDIGLMLPNAPPKTHPDLGSKEIEGLTCDGYQIKVKEGASVEYWFSRDLNQLVLAKAVSESGESTWRYFNFRFVEPNSSLFTVPADYKDASSAGGIEIEFPDPRTAGDNAKEVRIKLLDSGSTCGVKTKQDSEHAVLCRAALDGDVAAVKGLLATGVDVNVKDHNQYTPLMVAAGSGYTEVVKVLLAAGADVNAKSSLGKTALICASFSGHSDTAKVLLAKGADVNAKASYGQTALLLATFNGRSEFVDALLAAGADVNVQDSGGNTALIAAVGTGRVGIAQALLAHGADVNARNDEGYTPLKTAVRFGHTDIIELLKKAGAKE
jgi:ankyrin repeat protein